MFLQRRMAAAAQYQHREADRVIAALHGMLADATGAERPVRLRDLSNFGFMAECEDYLGIGSNVTLRIEGHEPMRAEIRWALAGWIGCRFGQELGRERLASLTGGHKNPSAE